MYYYTVVYTHTHTHTHTPKPPLLSIESIVVEVTQCSLQSCRGGGGVWGGWGFFFPVQSALKRPANIDLSVGEGVWGWGFRCN